MGGAWCAETYNINKMKSTDTIGGQKKKKGMNSFTVDNTTELCLTTESQDGETSTDTTWLTLSLLEEVEISRVFWLAVKSTESLLILLLLANDLMVWPNALLASSLLFFLSLHSAGVYPWIFSLLWDDFRRNRAILTAKNLQANHASLVITLLLESLLAKNEFGSDVPIGWVLYGKPKHPKTTFQEDNSLPCIDKQQWEGKDKEELTW